MGKETDTSGGGSSSLNHPTSAVAGGASTTPTPANNVGGDPSWGDNQGRGHADVREEPFIITVHNKY